MKSRALVAAVFFAAAWGTIASAAGMKRGFRVQENFPLSQGGTLVLENPIGNVEIYGSDLDGVDVDVMKTVVANDAESIEEGRNLTALRVGGDETTRVLRTTYGAPRTRRWSSSVSWRIRVPRTANLRVTSNSSEYVRVVNVRGNIFVKNFNGSLVFENTPGFITADSVNGSIVYNTPEMLAEARLSTINGHITARVRSDSDLRWVAETARGEVSTNLPVRGMFVGTSFRGSVNAPGGPLLTTSSLMGNVHLYGTGLPMDLVKSVRLAERVTVSPDDRGKVAKALTQKIVDGSVTYRTNFGDITLDEVRGNAMLSTGAGRIQLGSVAGDTTVISQGGTLQLGEILGALQASTAAGDVFVEAARRGGSITTTGGTIRLLYTGGPTRLSSGGGDIVVRQAAGPVNAETRSGDIAVTLDRLSKKQRVDARTEKGNILLNVGAGFAADMDVTIVTSDPNMNTVHSDLPGLSISREQVDGGKTRVRATGKINGGGERVTLQATDGSVRIITAPLGPALVGR